MTCIPSFSPARIVCDAFSPAELTIVTGRTFGPMSKILFSERRKTVSEE
jgi:hypothetical protein